MITARLGILAMSDPKPHECVICIKGAGEMASGVACRLFAANFHRLFLLEAPRPLAVRRRVSFSEVIFDGEKEVEGIKGILADGAKDLEWYWNRGEIPVLIDPGWSSIERHRPDVVVDAILAKRNLGTHKEEAPLTIGLGPGFSAGKDVHAVIETNRGHNLGRVITAGEAEANTGIPGNIAGFSAKRVLRAPRDGVFSARFELGDRVLENQIVGMVEGEPVRAGLDGLIRGLIRDGTPVPKGLKLGDIDPRGNDMYLDTVSDKARAIGGSVLEAVLNRFNI